MATTVPGKAVKPSVRLSFFFWMTALMAVFVFGGFGLTYWQPMMSGGLAPLPPVIHLHGAFFTSWIILLLVQPVLVSGNRVRLHRSLGTLGIAIGTGVFLSGALITVLFGRAMSPATVPDYYDLMYLSVMALVGFGIFFPLAIRQVRNPQNHKRLILFATLPLLPPGINRLYMVPLGLTTAPVLAMYLTLDAMIMAIFLHDWRTLGRISKVSLGGAAFLAVQQLLHAPVTGSDAFAGFLQGLAALAQYR